MCSRESLCESYTACRYSCARVWCFQNRKLQPSQKWKQQLHVHGCGRVSTRTWAAYKLAQSCICTLHPTSSYSRSSLRGWTLPGHQKRPVSSKDKRYCNDCTMQLTSESDSQGEVVYGWVVDVDRMYYYDTNM